MGKKLRMTEDERQQISMHRQNSNRSKGKTITETTTQQKTRTIPSRVAAAVDERFVRRNGADSDGHETVAAHEEERGQRDVQLGQVAVHHRVDRTCTTDKMLDMNAAETRE